MQVARGSVETDKDGARQATVLIPAGVQASLLLPDGSTQTASSLNIRLTEYTVGENGPNAMPAVLPATSAYTYCVELSADDAIAVGAKHIQFDKPVYFYVENFLGFPEGSGVPYGYYESDKKAWIPSKDGIVIKILINRLIIVLT
jgi:hypothetical protein